MSTPPTDRHQAVGAGVGGFRTLLPRQSAQLWLLDIKTEESRLLVTSDHQLFEAPNWHPSGEWIVVNAEGRLLRVAPKVGSSLQPIRSDGVPAVNNDHLVSPDGAHHYASAQDGHIWQISWDGGTGRPITTSKDVSRRFRHYLHGIFPDGELIAFVGTEALGDAPAGTRSLWIRNLTTGAEHLVGSGFSPADGPEFSPDGQWLYFNSEINSTTPGHAQIFRSDLTGGRLEQLSFDDRVNWFPHISPDGTYVAYLSFPVGTIGHPADRPVVIRLLHLASDKTRDAVTLHGGQGTINVNSWSPDSTMIAYVAYPTSPVPEIDLR